MGENKHPLAFVIDESFEELANPSKYPYGNGGFSAKREKPISVCKYFSQRLLHCDGKFAKDVEYLLAAQYVVESKQVRDETQIALRQTRGLTFHGQKVTVGTLKDAENMRAIVRTDLAFKFLKNVCSSPVYWQHVLYDLLAMVWQLGVPTWFLTLSSADMQWPDIIQSTGLQYGRRFSAEDIQHKSWEEKSQWL